MRWRDKRGIEGDTTRRDGTGSVCGGRQCTIPACKQYKVAQGHSEAVQECIAPVSVWHII